MLGKTFLAKHKLEPAMAGRTASLALVLALALPAGSGALAAGGPQVRLCQDSEDVYPWTLKERPGLNNILLKIVEAKLDITMVVEARPWRRCQEEIKAGTMDGMFAISFLPQRQEFGAYPMNGSAADPARRLMSDGYSLFRRKDDDSIHWNGKQLKAGGPVGAQRAYSVVPQLEALGAKVDDGTYPPEDNLRKLLMGRLAAVALRTQEGDSILATHREFNGRIERLPQPLVDKPYYLIFSHQFMARHGALAQQLWNTIAQVRESVEYRVFENSFR
jgi:polar amino acid transport system substrate-binding protein